MRRVEGWSPGGLAPRARNLTPPAFFPQLENKVAGPQAWFPVPIPCSCAQHTSCLSPLPVRGLRPPLSPCGLLAGPSHAPELQAQCRDACLKGGGWGASGSLSTPPRQPWLPTAAGAPAGDGCLGGSELRLYLPGPSLQCHLQPTTSLCPAFSTQLSFLGLPVRDPSPRSSRLRGPLAPKRGQKTS